MNINEKEWWRGSFPGWIVVILLSLLTWLGVRLVNEHDELVKRSLVNQDRILNLEFGLKSHGEQMLELKEVNITIRDQLEKLREELKKALQMRQQREAP